MVNEQAYLDDSVYVEDRGFCSVDIFLNNGERDNDTDNMKNVLIKKNPIVLEPQTQIQLIRFINKIRREHGQKTFQIEGKDV